MKSFYQKAREFYMKEGFDYKEASRHATADEKMWRDLLLGRAENDHI